MAKITLVSAGGTSDTTIVTHAAVVDIREVTQPIQFVTDNGEHLIINMRDNGFVVEYTAGFGENAYQSGPIYMRAGHVTKKYLEEIDPETL